MQHLYDRLINRIINVVPLVRLKRSEVGKDETENISQFIKPFITISRELGSGGQIIARNVATHLDFSLYDRKIIEDVSRDVNERKVLMESIDEHGRTAIEDIIHSTFNPEYISDIRYIRSLSLTILSAAMKGDVVILGRGANFLTPFDKGLHVRICAPYSVRVNRYVKFEGISREKAVQKISKTDKEREDFIRQYFGKDVSNPSYYDIVINTADISLSKAAFLIIAAFKYKFPESAKRIKSLQDNP